MDKIHGPSNLRYDPQYLQVSRRLTAESVKPNVFKDTEDPTKLLNTKDFTTLSPEAKELLRQLSRDPKKAKILFSKEEDFEKLLGNLKKMKKELAEDDEEDQEDSSKKESKGKKLYFQEKDGKYHIPISTTIVDNESNNTPHRPHTSVRNGDIIDAMLVSELSSTLHSAVLKELDPLGRKMLDFVRSFGVHIIMLTKNENLTQKRIKGMMIVAPGERSFDGRPWEVVRGIYVPDRRLIVAGEELLGHLNGSVMRHEFAHAFDHAYTSRNKRRLPLSVQLWNSFAKSRTALPSAYAATNPAEYFAESVDAFFIPAGRDYLMKNDQQMAEYLQVLFE